MFVFYSTLHMCHWIIIPSSKHAAKNKCTVVPDDSDRHVKPPYLPRTNVLEKIEATWKVGLEHQVVSHWGGLMMQDLLY